MPRRREIVRVVRILEYVGDRKWVEDSIARSIQGERDCGSVSGAPRKIRAATLGLYPDVLEQAIINERDQHYEPSGLTVPLDPDPS